jgi:hypothetical protein
MCLFDEIQISVVTNSLTRVGPSIITVVPFTERIGDQARNSDPKHLQADREHQADLVVSCDRRLALTESLSDLESAIISVQDSRKSAKEKAALIDYYASLLRSFELVKSLKQHADFNIMAADLSKHLEKPSH